MNTNRISLFILVVLVIFISYSSAYGSNSYQHSRTDSTPYDADFQRLVKAVNHLLLVAEKSGWRPCLEGLFNYIISKVLNSNDPSDEANLKFFSQKQAL